MQRDANMLVPDAQQPPADQDNDRGDPCPEDDNFFDRQDAATVEEAIGLALAGLLQSSTIFFMSM